MINGFPQVISAYPNARLVIVGKGPYVEELEELISELQLEEFVQFTGEVDNNDVALYYKAADYLSVLLLQKHKGLLIQKRWQPEHLVSWKEMLI